ncbi:MAG: SdrD B-like domain-containing protein [Bacteroidota bacterium]|nr:SdrD B-like domain-containing protein [Bacteroidota bacterium]
MELQHNYNNGTRINNALVSPSIDLTGAIAPVKLLFTENYATELGWDFCMVDVSIDGGSNWIHLRGGYGSAPCGDSKGWMISTLDLSPYVNNNINLRFYFDTGDSLFNEFPGWYVDDVLIFDQSGMITGKKFFDLNENHVKDIGERGIKEWLITGTGNGISLTTRTNYRGRYWLPLPLGSYTITETLQPNWTQTYPISGQWDITLSTPDTLVDSVHFGNYTHASFVNGIKFHDLDKDGIYDEGDTLLPEWKILLTDTLGNEIDFDRTDSLGQYQLYIFQPGKYIIREVPKKGWVQSYPAEEYYTIEIPNLHTVIDNKDFGNYYSPLTNAVIGKKFNDRNRNQICDPNEEGVPGFTIRLVVTDAEDEIIYDKKRITDSSGYYQFMSVPAGNCEVNEVIDQKNIGWWKSYPTSSYSLILNEGETLDSIDFGNYQIEPGSISGMKFDDLDTSGTKEPGEPGLSGWSIMLNGTTIYETSVNESQVTDGDGNYSFTSLWPGNYTVSEIWRSNWRQTHPENLQPHFVNLGKEENVAEKDFGNVVDDNFSLSFRTFIPESLALAVDQKGKHKPIPEKPIKTEFWLTLYNDTTAPAHSLIVHVTLPIDPATLTSSLPGSITYLDLRNKKVQIIFDSYVQPGEEVTLHGFSKKLGQQQATLQKWLIAGGATFKNTHQTYTNYLRLPMPNAINLLSAGAGTNLKVGLGGPHSVVHLTYKNVMKSLVEGRYNRTHIGDARCLDKFTNGSSIKKQQKYLTPTKGNNKLFAEAIALQVNIKGSDYRILPGGFGNLIFDQGGTNPMNGMTIRALAAAVDENMSSYKDTAQSPKCEMPFSLSGMDPETLWAKIRMINAAFSGPIDTNKYGGELEFKAVRPLSEVPFLRLDASFNNLGSFPTEPPVAYVPEQFTLYQNYPNPFNPTTVIEFYIPSQSFVTLKIFNALGQEVATILNKEEMGDGYQEIELDATTVNLASSVYYYRMIAETITDEDNPVGQKFVSVKKMLMIK